MVVITGVEALTKAIQRPESEEEAKAHQQQLLVDPLLSCVSLSHVEIQELYEVKAIPNKGQGMFATCRIEPGQLILREKPLIVMPDDVFSLEDSDAIEEWLDKKLMKLSSSDREIFFNLVDSRSFNGEKTALGIFYTNDMSYIDDSAALFPKMAKVNHACKPNADFITRPDLGVQDLVATQWIEKGQEINISYLPSAGEGSSKSEARKAYTREWYGFNCSCSECTLKGRAKQNNNKTRARIVELQNVKGIDRLSVLEHQELVEKLIKIGCKPLHQQMVCVKGFQKALAEGDWKIAAQFFAAGVLTESVLSSNEDLSQWSYVKQSIPVHIGSSIYLFPADEAVADIFPM